ncbi:polyserase-2-like [Culex pipiens pallens]|uniref:polyserase-2-like n=1 Tax=Culex pipiens pallens TaxID=42434 RepID=UPI001952EA04|nr:polyserase-2-like [Culex pipiens pallens]
MKRSIPISRGFPTDISALSATCLLLTCCGSPVQGAGVECGVRQLTHLGYIAHGYDAVEGDWPWHAGIFMNVPSGPQRYICGGSIISENFVITAAHCTVPNRNILAADDVSVRLGLHNRTGPSEHSKMYDVVEIIRHEAFNMDNLRNDVALLRMADDIEYSDYIQPVCLWPVEKKSLNSILNSRGYVVGWGLGDTKNLAELLQEAKLAAVEYETCLKSHPTHFQKLLSDDKSSYCAGNQNQTNVCSGDSGGGMYYNIGSSWYIRGLVSTGVRPVDDSAACNPKEYVIFSDIPYYLGWITKHQENVKKRNLLNLGSCGLDTYNASYPEQDKSLFLQYPWVAMLEFKVRGSTSNLTMCNGALIHPRFVVTVGHCVDDSASKYKLTSVRLGEYNFKTNPDKEKDAKGVEQSTFIQVIDIEKVIQHPMFNQPRYDNNIALLKLKTPADTGRPNVRPVCLPTLEDFNEVYTIAGWKRVGKQNHIIRRDIVALEDYGTCQSIYSKMKIKLSGEGSHICGTYHHKEQMDCFHYMAGAPLQYVKNADRKNQYFLKGVFAYGFPGCQLNYTDVFMSVNKYASWIKMVVEQEEGPL